MSKQMRLVFEDEATGLQLRVLAEYLSLFEACVLALHKHRCAPLLLSTGPTGYLDVDAPRNIQAIRASAATLRKIMPLEWNHHFSAPTDDLIEIKSISRTSPLVVVVGGMIVLIGLAVILSGGKIKVGLAGVEAELAPLGEGLKKLREGLGFAGRVQVGFSVRTITVQLSREELGLLMKQDPSTSGRGGFQKHLISLQYRVNRHTGKLDLSDTDLDRILDRMAKPERGGFQSRYRKIFGRHLLGDLPNDHG